MITSFVVSICSRTPNSTPSQLCKPAYRAALLELEEEGKVVVLDKNGVLAPKRKLYKGEKTLGEANTIRLA